MAADVAVVEIVHSLAEGRPINRKRSHDIKATCPDKQNHAAGKTAELVGIDASFLSHCCAETVGQMWSGSPPVPALC